LATPIFAVLLYIRHLFCYLVE